MSDPFCKCGHRRSEHFEHRNDWEECDEDDCDCPQYRRARGEEAAKLNEGAEVPDEA